VRMSSRSPASSSTSNSLIESNPPLRRDPEVLSAGP
jgi:hypothetical protein